MFKEVLAIGGKPGLFKLVSYAKNYVIVESLIDGKRQPAYQSEKISLLRDIVMFGNGGEKKLSQLFKATFDLEGGVGRHGIRVLLVGVPGGDVRGTVCHSCCAAL